MVKISHVGESNGPLETQNMPKTPPECFQMKDWPQKHHLEKKKLSRKIHQKWKYSKNRGKWPKSKNNF